MQKKRDQLKKSSKKIYRCDKTYRIKDKYISNLSTFKSKDHRYHQNEYLVVEDYKLTKV